MKDFFKQKLVFGDLRERIAVVQIVLALRTRSFTVNPAA